MSDLEMKSFGPFEIKSEDRGEVVAIVATLGVVDKDGDVIQPGAFPPGGSKVKLSSYSHDVITEGSAPVGKGTIREVDGKAVFEGNFFMSTQRGREAFLTTKELGPEGEWSFGFPKAVKTADMTDEWRSKGAKRVIAGLVPIEASPVFVGAGWGTGTLLTKSAEPVEVAPEPEPQADGDPAPLEAPLAAPAFAEVVNDHTVTVTAEPVESAEEKAAREANIALKAKIDDAMEEFHRVQRALKRMGYAA
jgi:hypothetical protein